VSPSCDRATRTLGKPFIDVGMGVFEEAFVKNECGRNIQIADLNALNAALAVVKWKKLYRFYVDLEKSILNCCKKLSISAVGDRKKLRRVSRMGCQSFQNPF
jgi:hypothetical protein